MDRDVSRIKVRIGDRDFDIELRDFTQRDYQRVFGSQPWDIPPTFVWAHDWDSPAVKQPASRSTIEMRRINGAWQRA